MAIIFRHQSRHYRRLSRDGIRPGAVGLGLVIALDVAFFAATPSGSTAAAPTAIASATPLTAPVVTDRRAKASPSWPIPAAAWASGFSSSTWDSTAGIPGFGPLTAPTRTHAFASEPR
jgi:hypothetical protein